MTILQKKCKQRWSGGLAVIMGLLLVGCAYTPERYHPNYADYGRNIRSVLLMPPEIKIFAEMADGSLFWQAAGSQAARKHVQHAMVQALAAKNIAVKVADSEFMDRPEARRVQILFRAVNRSIQLHTYGPQIFPAKQKSFDYGLGSVTDLLATGPIDSADSVDALVLAIGHQTISANRPKTWISIAVIEPGGHIIWYCMQGAKQDLALIDSKGALTLVHRTLQHLPGGAS